MAQEIRAGDTVLIPVTVVMADVQLDPDVLVEVPPTGKRIVVDRSQIVRKAEPALPPEPPDGALLLALPPDGDPGGVILVLERDDHADVVQSGAHWWVTGSGECLAWERVCSLWPPDRRVRLYRADDPAVAVLADAEQLGMAASSAARRVEQILAEQRAEVIAP